MKNKKQFYIITIYEIPMNPFQEKEKEKEKEEEEEEKKKEEEEIKVRFIFFISGCTSKTAVQNPYKRAYRPKLLKCQKRYLRLKTIEGKKND